MVHETPRDSQAVGEAPVGGRSVAGERPEYVGSSAADRMRQEFGMPVDGLVPAAGLGRTSSCAHSRAPVSALSGTEAAIGAPLARRSSAPRIPDRCMDAGADCRVDSQAVPGPVPPQPCLVVAARDGLELSAAGASSSAARRAGHRQVDALQVAPDKKRLNGWVHTWSFSTRAASCSFPTSSGRRHPRARRPMPGITTSRDISPRSVPWRCLPDGAAWPCTFAFNPEASTAWMSDDFSGTCSSIFAAPWSCSGTRARSTAAGQCKTSWLSIPGSNTSSSRRMLRNSTRLSMSGARATAGWPTAAPRTSRNSIACSVAPSRKPGFPKHFFGPVSKLRTCHGLITRSFLYLYEIQ